MSYADTLSFINYFLILILIYRVTKIKDKLKKIERNCLDKISEVDNGRR